MDEEPRHEKKNKKRRAISFDLLPVLGKRKVVKKNQGPPKKGKGVKRKGGTGASINPCLLPDFSGVCQV